MKTASDTTPEWRIFQSDAGRWWGTREQPFADVGVEDDLREDAGPWRTVDGDTEIELVRAIAEQEARAALGGTS